MKRLPPSAAPLAVLAAVTMLVAAACGGGSSPTSPDPAPPVPGPAPLSGAVLSGEVTEVDGQADVSGVSVEVVGTNLSVMTASDGSFHLDGVPEGDRRVEFSKAGRRGEVSLDAVESGESIDLVVALRAGGAEVQSMNRTGGGGQALGPLVLRIQPDAWNTNWAGSAGTVSAYLEGEGYDRIDPASVELWPGDPLDPDALPVFPTRTQLGGNHLRAFFSKSEAIAAVPNLETGISLDVTVRFVLDGLSDELVATVTIVGPAPVDEVALTLEKRTEGQDADRAPGPELVVGDPVLWTYEVANVGGLELVSVAVTDDRGVVVVCPGGTLRPGETMTCTGEGVVTEGQYVNVGTVTAVDSAGLVYSASDSSHYTGVQGEPLAGACGTGFWKNHLGDWLPTGYDPLQSVDSVFAQSVLYPDVASATLQEALSFGGGPDPADAAALLVRHAIAALLSAAHPEVTHPRTEAGIIADTDAALATGDRQTMLSAKDGLEGDNETGECPL